VIRRTRVSLELNSPHPPDVCALRLEAALAREAGRRAHGLSRQVAGLMQGHQFSLGYLSHGAREATPPVDAEVPTRWVQGKIQGWGDAPGSRIRLESDRKPAWDRVEQFLFYLGWTAGFLLLFWAISYLRSGELARAGGMLIAMSVPLLVAALYYRPSLSGRVAIEDRRLVSFVRAACDAELFEIRDLPNEPRPRRKAAQVGRSASLERRMGPDPRLNPETIEASILGTPDPARPDPAWPRVGSADEGQAKAPPENWSRSVEGPAEPDPSARRRDQPAP